MRNFLFVYPSLSLGGIETFFVRLAKQFESNNIRLNFLFLFSEGGSEELKGELSKHANIFYWDDLCLFGTVTGFAARAKLFMPLKSEKLKEYFSSCEVVHVSCALTYFSAMRVFAALNATVKIVFGVYHSNELAWGKNDVPVYEKYFRKFIFGHNNLLLLFFNDASKAITLEANEVTDVVSRTFPLGVELPLLPRKSLLKIENSLRIVSVGRLTEFKTYNIFMLGVVSDLVRKGFNIQYDIYGSGPLREKMASEILKLDLKDKVLLHGDLSYALLDSTLRKYDVFIGSGTALLHAAANGVPCITAIENESSAKTYGFFSDLQGADYHEQHSTYEKKNIKDVLDSFSNMDDGERIMLSEQHVNKSSMFSIEACASNFLSAFEKAPYYRCSSLPFYIYMAFFLKAEFVPRLLGKSSYRKKYDHIL